MCIIAIKIFLLFVSVLYSTSNMAVMLVEGVNECNQIYGKYFYIGTNMEYSSDNCYAIDLDKVAEISKDIAYDKINERFNKTVIEMKLK